MARIVSTLIAKYRGGQNFTTGRGGAKPLFVVIHYTATLSSAWNNLKYFSSKYVGASAHYFIDRNGDIYQSVLEKDTAWSVGSRTGYRHPRARNSNTVNIEVVAKNNQFTAAQQESLAILVKEIRERYGIAEANVLRHHDVTGKICPAWYVKPLSRWTSLLAKLKSYFAPKPAPKPAPAAPKPSVRYYPRYKGTSPSIVTALKALKLGYSYAHRKKVAAANGISGYRGTAAQNTKMLALLKAGKLKRP